MKILLLVGNGRSGIDLIQSLFDKHPEVSQFPGVFKWGEYYNDVKNVNDLRSVANIFIEQYKFFFDSRLNLRERHNELGENRDSFYLVDKSKFIKNFVDLFNTKKINKENIFTTIHLAYSLACGEQIEKKKFIILNIHQANLINEMEDLEYEIIYMIRHPIASISSAIKHWLEYKSGQDISPWSTHFHLDRQFNSLKKLVISKRKIHVIKLEKLHTQSEKVLKSLTTVVKMTFDKCLFNSTYHGKKWWGDALSKKYLNGLNPNFKNDIDNNFFFKKDIEILKYYLRDIFSIYAYEVNCHNLRNKLLKYFPLKVELIILKKEFLNFNIKNLFFSFYYFLKRITLMKNDNFKNIILPSEVGK